MGYGSGILIVRDDRSPGNQELFVILTEHRVHGVAAIAAQAALLRRAERCKDEQPTVTDQGRYGMNLRPAVLARSREICHADSESLRAPSAISGAARTNCPQDCT